MHNCGAVFHWHHVHTYQHQRACLFELAELMCVSVQLFKQQWDAMRLCFWYTRFWLTHIALNCSCASHMHAENAKSRTAIITAASWVISACSEQPKAVSLAHHARAQPAFGLLGIPSRIAAGPYPNKCRKDKLHPYLTSRLLIDRSTTQVGPLN